MMDRDLYLYSPPLPSCDVYISHCNGVVPGDDKNLTFQRNLSLIMRIGSTCSAMTLND